MSENQLKKSQSHVASPHPLRRGMGRYTKCLSYGSITANCTIIVQIFGCKTKSLKNVFKHGSIKETMR